MTRAERYMVEAHRRGLGDFWNPSLEGVLTALFFVPLGAGAAGLVVGGLLYGVGGAIVGTILGIAAGIGGFLVWTKLAGAR